MNIGDLIVRIGAVAEGLAKGFSEAEGKLKKWGEKMTQVGTSMTMGITAPLAALGGLAFRATASFDKAMTASTAIMQDFSEDMRQTMEDTARDVAKSTSFSADQAASAYYYMASAGLTAAQSIKLLPVVANFAMAGQFDLAAATSYLADAQSALGYATQDAEQHMQNARRVVDVLTLANIKANASTEQFSIALTTKAGNALRMVNKEIEEGVAVLAVYANQGIKAQDAGTQLAILLRDLQRRAIENEGAFKRYGVAVFDSTGTMRNLADIIGDIEVGLAGMSDQTKRAAIMEMGFADRSVGALLAVLGFSGELRKLEAELKEAGGTTDRVANMQLANLSDQFTLLWHSANDVAISLGKALLPAFDALRTMLSGVLEGLGAAAKWFGKWPAFLRTFVGTLGMLAAALGPVILGLGMITKALGGLGAALAWAAPHLYKALFAGPWGPVALAVGVTATAITALSSAAKKGIAPVRELAGAFLPFQTTGLAEKIASVHKALLELQSLATRTPATMMGAGTADTRVADAAVAKLKAQLEDLLNTQRLLASEPAWEEYRQSMEQVSFAFQKGGSEAERLKGELDALNTLVPKLTAIWGAESDEVKGLSLQQEKLRKQTAGYRDDAGDVKLFADQWESLRVSLGTATFQYLRTGDSLGYMKDQFALNQQAINGMVEEAVKADRVLALFEDKDFSNLIAQQNELGEAIHKAMQPFGEGDLQAAQDQLTAWADSMALTATDLVGVLKTTWDTFTSAAGNAFAQVIVYGEDFGEAMTKMGKDVLASLISMLIKLALEWLAFLVLSMLGITTQAGVKIGAEMAYGAVAAAASAYAAIPFPANMIAGPAAGAAALVAMSALAATGWASGKASSAMGSVGVHGEGGVFLHPTLGIIGDRPEAVIPLDEFDFGSGGAITIIQELDGRVLSESVVRNAPAVVRLRGGVRGG